jgi:hypothetical protein
MSYLKNSFFGNVTLRMNFNFDFRYQSTCFFIDILKIIFFLLALIMNKTLLKMADNIVHSRTMKIRYYER